MNLYYVAAIWLGMALLASVVSIKIAIPAALVEIVVGGLAGNIPGIREHVTQTDVVTFLASVGSLVLTFLAGGRDRSGVAARPLEGQPVHGRRVVRRAVCGRVRVLRPGSPLAPACR